MPMGKQLRFLCHGRQMGTITIRKCLRLFREQGFLSLLFGCYVKHVRSVTDVVAHVTFNPS